MEKNSHPFIVQFYQCLKDANMIYFLIEYVRGLELFDFIRDMGIFLGILSVDGDFMLIKGY